MFIHFLILIFGFVFVSRTITIQINRKPLIEATLQDLKKIQWPFFCCLTILSTGLQPLTILFLIFTLVFFINHTDLWINFILRQNFQQLWLQFLDELILLMMTGRSFRDSFLFITENRQNLFHLKLREILLRSAYDQNSTNSSHLLSANNIFIHNLVQSIEKNPHKALEKLKCHRRQIRLNVLFKKKSKQITLTMRTQAMALSLLYIGLLIFVLNKHSDEIFFLKKSMLFTSIGLFGLGLVLISIIGRKRPWKT